MDHLYWQNIDHLQFNVFIRDLSERLNSNVKNIIEDSFNDIKKKNIKPNKKPKKKDLIIIEQTKKREERNFNDDLNKIKYFIDKLDINNDLYKNIKYLKTEKGTLHYKFSVLEKLWGNENLSIIFDKIIGLYYQVSNSNSKYPDHMKILNGISKVLDKYDYRLYMLQNLGHILPPLNLWDKRDHRLEDWQLQILNHVKHNHSVLVRAPTSSGKSFIGMGVATIHKKILYVCPVEPVAYQVGSHFTKMGYKIKYLLPNFEYSSFDDKTQIFIGIPSIIEKMLYKINNKFDYAVFDEIHNLNKEDDGHMYENIIKYIQCDFLALSATIKNIDRLKDIFQKINPYKTIHLIEYNKRFINQQRWIWKNNGLVELHPFACLDEINDDLLDYNLAFSPKDSATLWECIENEFNKRYDNFEDEKYSDIEDMVDKLSPDYYFESLDKNTILTLDKSKEYEYFLKKKFIELNNQYPDIVNNILDTFKIDYDKCDNILTFLQMCKKNDMLPMILFNTKHSNCINLFKTIYNKLVNEESKNYPYHYDVLERKDKLYEDYQNKREKYQSGIKIPKKCKDPQSEIMNKMQNFDQMERDNYIQNMNNYYESLLDNIKDNNLQYKNLKREFNNFIANPDFCKQDIFKKHSKYTFVDNEPMSGDTIKKIRKEIQKTLGIKIDYEHILFQMLKRGIGIYIQGMPNEYNWIVQKLLASKEIGIVISDRSLCLGIDLPIRTSCIVGSNRNEFTNDDYLQMSGRAGRRGYDTKGNIIFYNIDYKELMRGELPEIVGSTKPIYDNYKCIPNTDIMFHNFINNRDIIQCETFDSLQQKNIYLPKSQEMCWQLREYKNSQMFIHKFKTLEKELYLIKHDFDREVHLLNLISKDLGLLDILDIYKLNRIETDVHDSVKILEEYIQIIMNVYNHLDKRKYLITREVFKRIYDKLKHIILNHSGINYF